MTVDSQLATFKYRISADSTESAGLSLIQLALARMCGNKACPACSQNSTFETFKDVMRAISTGCSKQDGYLGAGMPILEIAFRVLLSKGNKPQTLDALVDRMVQAWDEYIHLKNRRPATIAMVLGSHNDYGIIQVA